MLQSVAEAHAENVSDHFYIIHPDASDAAGRQSLCAVYANTTGQADAARQLAEATAQPKAEYRDQLGLLFAQ
jgi:hypothetical protein